MRTDIKDLLANKTLRPSKQKMYSFGDYLKVDKNIVRLYDSPLKFALCSFEKKYVSCITNSERYNSLWICVKINFCVVVKKSYRLSVLQVHYFYLFWRYFRPHFLFFSVVKWLENLHWIFSLVLTFSGSSSIWFCECLQFLGVIEGILFSSNFLSIEKCFVSSLTVLVLWLVCEDLFALRISDQFLIISCNFSWGAKRLGVSFLAHLGSVFATWISCLFPKPSLVKFE